MANQKLSKLVLPGSSNVYEIDAMYLNGKTLDEIMSATMSFKGTVAPAQTSATVNFATANGKYYIEGTNHTAGDAYKVVFNPTSQTGDMYESSTATANGSTSFAISHGDMVIYTADGKWVLIPSGNDEQVGTVTSITAGEGLSGGTISSSGTIDVDYTKVAKVAHTHTFNETKNIDASVVIPEINVAASYTPTGTVGISVGGETGTAYTPAGTITNVHFEGTKIENRDIEFTPNVTGSTATHKPAGIVSKPNFTGSEGNVSVSGTPLGSLEGLTFTGTENQKATIDAETVVTHATITGYDYTPQVTVPSTDLSTIVTSNTEEVVKSISVTPGTAPSITNWGSFTHNYAANTKTLTLTFNDGTFSAGSHTTVSSTPVSVTKAVTAGTIPQQIAQGTATTIAPTLNLTKDEVKATYKATGSVTGNFVGTATTFTGTFTPEGSVSQPTFSSTQEIQYVTSVNTSAQTVDLPDFTPAGTVTANFTGTATKIGASFTGTAGTATQTINSKTADVSGTVTVSGTTSTATNQ